MSGIRLLKNYVLEFGSDSVKMCYGRICLGCVFVKLGFVSSLFKLKYN